MTNNNDQINQLVHKLEILLKRQENFSKEINDLKDEINTLKDSNRNLSTENTKQNIAETEVETDFDNQKSPEKTDFEYSKEFNTETSIKVKSSPQTESSKPNKPQRKSDLEKFIGENLINKIGIIITVIGVAIGAKYSIENELISPLTRIVLGYLAGFGLLGFGIKLKKKYENYSAVLVSGAMAILYFITYFAYDFYDLIPQILAFALMVIFTVFTVLAAINYNRQIIAHIGLVGAYAIPFLLSDGSGKVAILFSYMAIINIGILAIAFKKYWKSLYYVSFGLTWLIYFVWYISQYQIETDYGLALIFLSIFFAIFYLTFLSYKLLRKEKFEINDIVLLLINSFIFYGIGFMILNSHDTGEQLLGVFTLCNAIVHFIVSFVIYRQKQTDRNLFYLVSGLVLVFITIAVPVQLDGNWVTLLWACEAALLFWIGRTKNVLVYEKLSYPLMLLAFFSIMHDWSYVYASYEPEYPETRITPLLNINFLTSVLFVLAFGFINFLNQKYQTQAIQKQGSVSKVMSFIIPAILLFTIYYAFRIEIANYWNQLYADSAILINSENQQYPDYYRNLDLKRFKTIWTINYSLLFVAILSFLNFRKFKSQKLGQINLGLIALSMLVFLTLGLYELSELRESYLEQYLSEYYQRSAFNIGIRYISFAFVALMLLACYKYLKQAFMQTNFTTAFDLLFHTSVLWIASSELIHWLDITELAQSYKLGLSILWGMYSLLLIVLGIWKRKKTLRIGAIVLFGITLIKLFFYDISHLDTIAKTVVFVSLGVLLLIISFLYNKYKQNISDETKH